MYLALFEEVVKDVNFTRPCCGLVLDCIGVLAVCQCFDQISLRVPVGLSRILVGGRFAFFLIS